MYWAHILAHLLAHPRLVIWRMSEVEQGMLEVTGVSTNVLRPPVFNVGTVWFGFFFSLFFFFLGGGSLRDLCGSAFLELPVRFKGILTGCRFLLCPCCSRGFNKVYASAISVLKDLNSCQIFAVYLYE